jgi:hypothetical protein
MNFKLWLEGFGEYLDKGHIKELCGLILSNRDKEHAIRILADLYDDVGNDLKASVIRGMLSVDDGSEEESHRATVATSMRGMYERSLKFGRDDGYLVFGIGSYPEDFRRTPWIETSYFVAGDDVFEDGVKYRKTLKHSINIDNISFIVNIFCRVKKSILEKCYEMQMSVNQYVDMTKENPVDVKGIVVSIRPFELLKK